MLEAQLLTREQIEARRAHYFAEQRWDSDTDPPFDAQTDSSEDTDPDMPSLCWSPESEYAQLQRHRIEAAAHWLLVGPALTARFQPIDMAFASRGRRQLQAAIREGGWAAL